MGDRDQESDSITGSTVTLLSCTVHFQSSIIFQPNAWTENQKDDTRSTHQSEKSHSGTNKCSYIIVIGAKELPRQNTT